MHLIPDAHDVTLHIIYEREREDERAAALDVLFEYVDDHYINDEFELIEDFFKRIDLNRLSTTLVVGLLSITNVAKDKLPYRERLAQRCRKHLWNCGRLKNKRQEKRLLGGLMDL